MTRLVLGLIAALAVLLGLAVAKGREEGRLRAEIEAYAACNQALSGADILVSAERCEAPIAAVHAAARRAALCDQALLEAEVFTVRAACSTEVMTLQGQRDAETHRADRQTEALAAERSGRAAAISRAEARARLETERSQRAQVAIRDAPRTDGGLVVLDARRLCELADATTPCDAYP